MRPPRIRRRLTTTTVAALAAAAVASSAAAAPSAPASGPATAKRATAAKVSWAPPKLVDPVTIRVPDTGSIQGRGHWPHVVTMDPRRDYLVEIGHRRQAGGVVLSGGRNVVVVGGRITIPTMSVTPSDSERWRRTCLSVERATGTVHVEGLLCDGEQSARGGSELTEGIIVNTPDARALQLQNIRIVGVRAFDRQGWTDNHPDLVQCWACPRTVRIDGFTGESDYQGLQLCHTPGIAGSAPIATASLRRVNLRATYKTLHVSLWPCARSTRYEFDDVYVEGGDRWGLDQAVGCRVEYAPAWHCEQDGRKFVGAAGRAVSAARYQSKPGDYVWWPDPREGIAGKVVFGDPAGGDFVPAGAVGENYRAPGYA